MIQYPYNIYFNILHDRIHWIRVKSVANPAFQNLAGHLGEEFCGRAGSSAQRGQSSAQIVHCFVEKISITGRIPKLYCIFTVTVYIYCIFSIQKQFLYDDI